MSQTHKYKEKITAALYSITEKQDLKPFLDHISFTVLQQVVGEIINNNNNLSIDSSLNYKSLYYAIASIDEIFPSDIIQHIIAFESLHVSNAKCVNKQWNKLYHMNAKKGWSEMKDHEETHGLPYDENKNTTRIVSTKRNQLTKSEADMGFEMGRVLRTKEDDDGVTRYIYTIDLSNAISGDRYFIWPDYYQMNNPTILRKKNLSFIGMPSHNGLYSDSGVRIFFGSDYDARAAIYIEQGQFRMFRCRITSVCCGIYVGENSSLSLIKSQIEGGPFHAAIIIADCNKVVIEQTVIEGSKNGIHLIRMNQDQGKKLICRDNLFKNINSYAIINKERIVGWRDHYQREFYQMDKKYDSYEIENNDWKWEYLRAKPVTQNHNRIYVCRTS